MFELSQQTKDYLHRNLIKLGDMMGDGLHHEADGKWIEVEYRRTLKALGMLPKRRNNTAIINERMIQRVKDVNCGHCQGQLKQTRSGSKRAACQSCGRRWQLLK
ncbi:hypothetical protein E1100_25755 [Vibrio owensii]|uniref:hypothetical protein n=1 Tax=Vibrio owensii TaxID=696485 RepID=UPI001046E969|nr:hypothetical protein [Vibrio owensii]TDE19268.1 hypothetical protein E1100_25755 [Vibrio owensii]